MKTTEIIKPAMQGWKKSTRKVVPDRAPWIMRIKRTKILVTEASQLLPVHGSVTITNAPDLGSHALLLVIRNNFAGLRAFQIFFKFFFVMSSGFSFAFYIL
ncbi:hypothetical protein OSTOST_10227 [Ostertagia ostertagi]